MKGIMIAGMAAVILLGAKSMVMGAELTGSCYGDGVYHEGCLRYSSSSVRLENRHHCVNTDAAWDVSCHDVDWHYEQHGNADWSAYCAEHGYTYGDCRYEHETGYCIGGGCGANAGTGNGNGANGNANDGTANGNSGSYGNYGNDSTGNGNSQYSQNGYQSGGSGHHGSGHHGRGHH